MQFNIEVFQRFSKRLLEKVGEQGAPEQRNSTGPICAREALDGSELNETVTSCGRIPEFIKARFASMGVSRNIGMKVPEDFMDLQTAIAGRQLFQLPIRQLQVQQRISALVGPGSLGRNSDIESSKEVRERRMVLPKSQDRCEPARSQEERILVDRNSAE